MVRDEAIMADWPQSLSRTCRKTFKQGTHRSATPDVTLARFRHLAAGMGITRLGNVTGLDRIGIPVAIAVRPNSRSFSVSQGKGLTLTHAFASAFMEAAEIFHGENLADRLHFSSTHELAAHARLVDPRSLCMGDEPPTRLQSIGWIEGYDLMSREACWLPAETVDTDATLPRKPGRGFFVSGTNGLASGNHIWEALSAGICEVVERDAVALWNASSVRARRLLDLASVDDPDARFILEAYDKAGMSVRVWDATSDIGVPTFLCDAIDMNRNPSAALPRCRGAGCHPDRTIALVRSLTEAAQVRLTHISGIRDDIAASAYRKSPLQELGIALIDALSESGERSAFRNVATFHSDTVEGDVEWILNRLRITGIDQVLAVDLTRPEIGIPVVRVVIPALEGNCSDPSYAPGPRARQAARGEL
jgi:YcaO-like protein with predicted kinase domain